MVNKRCLSQEEIIAARDIAKTLIKGLYDVSRREILAYSENSTGISEVYLTLHNSLVGPSRLTTEYALQFEDPEARDREDNSVLTIICNSLGNPKSRLTAERNQDLIGLRKLAAEGGRYYDVTPDDLGLRSLNFSQLAPILGKGVAKVLEKYVTSALGEYEASKSHMPLSSEWFNPRTMLVAQTTSTGLLKRHSKPKIVIISPQVLSGSLSSEMRNTGTLEVIAEGLECRTSDDSEDEEVQLDPHQFEELNRRGLLSRDLALRAKPYDHDAIPHEPLSTGYNVLNEPPKRKRGRPRKNPIINPEQPIVHPVEPLRTEATTQEEPLNPDVTDRLRKKGYPV